MCSDGSFVKWKQWLVLLGVTTACNPKLRHTWQYTYVCTHKLMLLHTLTAVATNTAENRRLPA
jgi:hypothetical protein